MQVNMFEAKTTLSKLVASLEAGEEDSVVLARNGTPVAKLVLIENKPRPARIGGAKGRFKAPADPFEGDAELAALFTASAAEA